MNESIKKIVDQISCVEFINDKKPVAHDLVWLKDINNEFSFVIPLSEFSKKRVVDRYCEKQTKFKTKIDMMTK